ncbi:MAG: response regulator transcription factor [Magnetococcales bacterium]|nr:response regulator transcription factor [Magnetococcales bacterium]
MHQSTPLICLLEDDDSMRFLMSSYLEKSGFRVIACATSTDFFAAFEQKKPDCVLLDLNLPDEDGLVVLRKIRHYSNLPLFVISSRSGEQDRLAGIELGADDYIIKPFHPRELIAKIQNILHRNAKSASQGSTLVDMPAAIIPFEGFVLDFAQRRLTTARGEWVVLTRGEFNCLATIIKARGAVVSREQLKDAISRRQDPPQNRTVDSIICRLRQKMEQAGQGGTLIMTVSGYGYQLNPNALQKR